MRSRKGILLFCWMLSVFAIISQASSVAAQTKSSAARAPATKQVRIYLAMEVSESDKFDSKNPGNLQPVFRKVSAAAPLRETLLLLLAGPTHPEEAAGYSDISYGIKLVSVRMRGSTVRADFTMPPGAAFSGDMSPFYFRDAVEFTTKQFPQVKKVIVCLDGILDFWSESDEPPKKCPKL